MVLKYIRPNIKEYGHTIVLINGLYVGYFMPNRSKFSVIGENYNFESKVYGILSFCESNRNKIIKRLKRIFKISKLIF